MLIQQSLALPPRQQEFDLAARARLTKSRRMPTSTTPITHPPLLETLKNTIPACLVVVYVTNSRSSKRSTWHISINIGVVTTPLTMTMTILECNLYTTRHHHVKAWSAMIYRFIKYKYLALNRTFPLPLFSQTHSRKEMLFHSYTILDPSTTISLQFFQSLFFCFR